VRDSTIVHGPDHRETLAARINLARQVGAAGNPRKALTMAREADAAATVALGANDQTTISARFEVAVWTGEADGAAAGAKRFTDIQQEEQLDPPPQQLIADSMTSLAECLSGAGDHAQAIQASEDAISLGQQLWAQPMPASCGCGSPRPTWSDHPVTLKLPLISAAAWRTPAPRSSAGRT
jgi:hypothetical protein